MTANRTRGGHPVDAQGRILPDPSWPADRAAPDDLELVRRFCNSFVRENGADRFATGTGFDRWLLHEGQRATKPSANDLARIVAFREALHAITVANSQHQPTIGAWEELADLIADVTFSMRAQRDGLDLVPNARSATAAFLGNLALICRRAHDDGTLQRLKSCANCEWTIYDASKNQSGRWCSMNVCGGRHNARTYRQRRRR